jgi:hypothetical protein
VGGNPTTEASIDCQVVKKDAGAYLSKYFSKAVNNLGYLVEIAPCQIPSRWWSSSKNVKDATKKYTVDIPPAVAEFIFYRGGGNPGEILYLRYFRYIYAPMGDAEICFGLSAHIRDSDAKPLRGEAFWSELVYDL